MGETGECGGNSCNRREEGKHPVTHQKTLTMPIGSNGLQRAFVLSAFTITTDGRLGTVMASLLSQGVWQGPGSSHSVTVSFGPSCLGAIRVWAKERTLHLMAKVFILCTLCPFCDLHWPRIGRPIIRVTALDSYEKCPARQQCVHCNWSCITLQLCYHMQADLNKACMKTHITVLASLCCYHGQI